MNDDDDCEGVAAAAAAAEEEEEEDSQTVQDDCPILALKKMGRRFHRPLSHGQHRWFQTDVEHVVQMHYVMQNVEDAEMVQLKVTQMMRAQ